MEDEEVELVQCPALIRREQKLRLDRLHRITRIPRNVLIRESIDDLLEKYEQRRRRVEQAP